MLPITQTPIFKQLNVGRETTADGVDCYSAQMSFKSLVPVENLEGMTEDEIKAHLARMIRQNALEVTAGIGEFEQMQLLGENW